MDSSPAETSTAAEHVSERPDGQAQTRRPARSGLARVVDIRVSAGPIGRTAYGWTALAGGWAADRAGACSPRWSGCRAVVNGEDRRDRSCHQA